MIDLEKNPIITIHYSYYHGIIPFEEVKVGQKWISSGGNIVTITKIGEDQWIYYDQECGAPPNNKENFAFQCRYCLLVEHYESERRL